MTVTLIANADLVVAYDAPAHTHVYRRNCDVAFDEGGIRFVGPGHDGPIARRIDGRGCMVMPGLVDIHSHPSSEPANKGLTDEVGSARLYNSSLYEYLYTFRVDPEGIAHCNHVAWSELLRSGVTTLVDLSVPSEGWLERAVASGLRICLAPMFRSGRWFTRNGHSVEYEWDEAAGRRGLDEALAIIDRAKAHPSGRLSGMLAPAQIDTCSEDLIRDAVAAAGGRGMPIQIHCAQSLVEFLEITRRHGLTGVEWLDRLGFLGPTASIGHGIFLDHHPAVNWPSRTDLSRLAASGTSVAHCPTVFSRRGVTLRDLGSYLAAGVNVAIGTDTYPHNMLEEMRMAAILARVTAGSPRNVKTSQVFEAATLGGARLLGREDIGRIAVGAQSDLVLVDLSHPAMRPVGEPIGSLVYAAAERAIRRVFVAGALVVEDGRVLTMDYAEAAAGVEESQRRTRSRVRQLDWASREIDELVPPAFRYVD